MPDPRDPIEAREWQQAVDLAEFMLLLEAGKRCGLIEWETVIAPERCCQIIARGAELGFKPATEPELIKKFLVPAGGLR